MIKFSVPLSMLVYLPPRIAANKTKPPKSPEGQGSFRGFQTHNQPDFSRRPAHSHLGISPAIAPCQPTRRTASADLLNTTSREGDSNQQLVSTKQQLVRANQLLVRTKGTVALCKPTVALCKGTVASRKPTVALVAPAGWLWSTPPLEVSNPSADCNCCLC